MPAYQSQFRTHAPRRWPRLLFAAALVAAALAVGALGFTRPVQAATITVNTPADEFNTGAACSLREAIQAANTDTAFGGCSGGSGADTITLGSGTFSIAIGPGPDENVNAAGDFDIASSITLQGGGAGSTIIDGGGVDRVFDIAPNGGPNITVEFSGLTIRNGRGLSTNFAVGGGMFINNNATVTINNSTLADNQSVTNAGGAIQNLGTLTLNSVTLQNNTAFSLGGAINNIGVLTVNNSTFTGNRAERGGALHINTDSGKTVNISGSTFSSNQALATGGGAGDDGGAIAIDTDGTVNITKSTFTGNSAAANGGAIYLNDNNTQGTTGTLVLSYSRIVGNTAAAGGGLFRASGSATAERNWWGCNSGPAGGPCDLVAGAVDFTPWIVLSHTASPSSIGTGQAATLTADFLRNSDGSSNAPGDLGALVGVPVSFGNAVLGAISNAQTTIQSNGAATATYTAGAAPGAGSANATVDSATVTANVTIIQSDTTAPNVTINQAAGQADPTSAGPIHFTVVFDEPVTGFGNSDVTLAGTAGATTAVVTEIAPNDGTTYDVAVSGMTTGGTVIATVPAGAAADAANNGNTASTSTDNTVTYAPNQAPNVTINQAAGQADPTGGSPIHFTVVFDEPVTGFGDSTSDVTLGGTAGATTAVVTPIAPNDGTTYDVAVSGMTGDGTVIATVPAGAAGDGQGAPNNVSTSTDNTVTFVANQAPNVTINQAAGQADPTNTSPIHFTVVFDESVTGFGDSAADVTLSGTAGATTAVVTPIAPNDGTTYDVAVSGMTTGGTVIATVPAGAAGDGQGAPNNASTSTDNTVTYVAVNAPPTITVAAGGVCDSSGAIGTMNLTLGDADSPLNSVTLTASSSNTNLAPVANIVFGGSLGNRTVTITAVQQATTQRAEVTITATDAGGAAGSVKITVIAVAEANKKVKTNGTRNVDMIFGQSGADSISAGDSNDLVCGRNGDDDIGGAAGNDTLDGGEGKDKVHGDSGHDIVRGGPGDDKLEGNEGDDILTGNAGADYFRGGTGTNQYTDFTPSEGDKQEKRREFEGDILVFDQLYLPIVVR